MQPIVIIGTGLAGYTLAREYRKRNGTAPLLMITADDGAYYSKPMLSNALLREKTPAQLVNTSVEKMAVDLDAQIKTHAQVEAIDTEARTLRVGGESVAYSALVLAVGAKPIRLPLEGEGADDVLSINNLADYTHFDKKRQGARRIAILGPGLIGCEFANDLAAAGHAVSVIGPDAHPLGRLLPPEAGEAVREALAGIGVRWHLGTTVARVDGKDGAYTLTLANGDVLEADLVLSAIGLAANVDLARQAGLAVNRGIVVDGHLGSSVKQVYALGDCAEVNGAVLPFVLPLMEQARTLAAVLAGESAEVNYPPMPVAVKTPACPVVVAPPPPGAAGDWKIAMQEGGVHAEFVDGDRLLGFALTGTATTAKQALTKRLGEGV